MLALPHLKWHTHYAVKLGFNLIFVFCLDLLFCLLDLAVHSCVLDNVQCIAVYGFIGK